MSKSSVLTSKIIEQRKTQGVAPASLFGFNLEWCSDVPAGISSERISNTTFRGPADHQTGLAPGWKKWFESGAGTVFELLPGHNRLGGSAQRVKSDGFSHPFVHPNIWVRQGERLRVVICARCQGGPVRLKVGIRSISFYLGTVVCEADLKITTPYMARYETVLVPTVSDEHSLFSCQVIGRGEVFFERISIRSYNEKSSRRDTVAKLRMLRIADLRWPGGCLASGYHWKRGVGETEERFDDADPTFHWGLCYTWGTNEYLSLCGELGIRPHITVNIGTGTPAEAGDWAAYCAGWYRQRHKMPPPMVWQVGNEHYSPGEIGHMEGASYVSVFHEFAVRIRRAYPRAILCTAATSLDDVSGVPANFLDPIMKARSEPVRPDLYAVHFYATPPASSPIAEIEYLLDAADRLGKGLDALAARLRRYAPLARLAVTEWGVIRGETHTNMEFYAPIQSWVTAYHGAILENMVRRSGMVALANHYHLLNFLPLVIARGPNVETTAVYDFFRFWRPLFPARMQALRLEGERWVSGLTGCGPKGDWLVVSNRHTETAARVTVPGRWTGAAVEQLVPDSTGWHLSVVRSPRRLAGTTLEVPPTSSIRFSFF